MTDTIIIAAIAALPPTIMSLAALIRGNSNSNKMTIQNDLIHAAVNSNMNEALHKIIELKNEVAELRATALALALTVRPNE